MKPVASLKHQKDQWVDGVKELCKMQHGYWGASCFNLVDSVGLPIPTNGNRFTCTLYVNANLTRPPVGPDSQRAGELIDESRCPDRKSYRVPLWGVPSGQRGLEVQKLCLKLQPIEHVSPSFFNMQRSVPPFYRCRPWAQRGEVLWAGPQSWRRNAEIIARIFDAGRCPIISTIYGAPPLLRAPLPKLHHTFLLQSFQPPKNPKSWLSSFYNGEGQGPERPYKE